MRALRLVCVLSLVLTACAGQVVPDAGLSSGNPSSTPAVSQAPIQKVDLLYDIDNSASMGDKQAYLIEATPQMIARLVTPRCVDGAGAATGATVDPTTGTCPAGSSPEFAPVHDLHIGIVTSSLGPRLGVASNGPPASYVCDPSLRVTSEAGVTGSAHNDDQGHLINRTGPLGLGAALPEATLAEGGGFLSWFPALGNKGKAAVTPPQAITQAGAAGSAGTLIGDFTELVGGAGESGCGIESQLESWYRFLVQPDPYLTLVNDGGHAKWSGVDATILQQRHDFLRPDSLVAVVVLSDENDSEIDVRSYQGSGYLFMSSTYDPPRATSPCETDPNSPDCEPCPTNCPAGGAACADPNCLTTGGIFRGGWGNNLNLRHVHMPQKYALDPQYPLTRYHNGLTSPAVPNRVGEYPEGASSYAGTNNCTNPLFASELPTAADVPDYASTTPDEIATTLCNLPTGAARNPADVFYAHVGGVPHQLLQSVPGDGTCPAGTPAADCPQKDTLVAADWIRILGKGPASYTGGGGTPSYDSTGIDPHMIEAMTPRNVAGLPDSFPAPASDPAVRTLSGPTFTGNPAPDPINGREWTTNAGVHALPVDLEYACIFELPLASQRDCATLDADTIEGNSCDCVPGGTGRDPSRRAPAYAPGQSPCTTRSIFP